MQKLPAGAVVRSRGERWRVSSVRSYDDCQTVTVQNSSSAQRVDGAPLERVFLEPFEAMRPVATTSRPRPVSGRRWRAVCHTPLAEETPPGCLRAAARANVAVWPYQLAPALAVVRGLGCRVLLADEVGLGKTIQAGLILAELLARVAIERMLIVTPAGLRDQWRDELDRRFAVFVLKTPLPLTAQYFLCGLFNSLVALVGRLYQLSIGEFQYLLDTFPLVDRAARSDALRQLASQL
jgi:hypothetical protein